MKKIIPPLVSFLILLVALEFIVQWNWVHESLLPSPSSVGQALWENRGDFSAAFFSTLKNTLWGWLFSILVGFLIAFCFSLSKILRQALLPFAIFFQTVPIIALAPLLVIYFGFGAPTVIAASFIVALFPMIANTLMGLDSALPAQKDLFRLYGASPWQILWKLQLPSAWNYIYSGLKISAGLAIIGAIAGEFVSGGGLGAIIDSAKTQQRVDLVFAALFLLSVMGLLLLATLALLERLFFHRFSFSATSHLRRSV